jgi:hypothetical protein
MTRPTEDAKLIAATYKSMLADIERPWCFWCGRGLEHKPSGWYGAPWLVERAHIVAFPRVEDRRAVILLCSWCHKVQHGEQLVLPGMAQMKLVPTVANMLWLKLNFDPDYYDLEWLRDHSISRLPRATCSRRALKNYSQRRTV